MPPQPTQLIPSQCIHVYAVVVAGLHVWAGDIMPQEVCMEIFKDPAIIVKSHADKLM